MSSTSIERLWSKLKRVLVKSRASLDPENAAKQVWLYEMDLSLVRLGKRWGEKVLRTPKPMPERPTFDFGDFLGAHE